MYDIRLSTRTADGTLLDTVYLPNKPWDSAKVAALRASMTTSGWVGRPVILADAGDHTLALTGSHRLAAAQGLDGVISAVYLPADLTAEQWAEINAANDDDDLLAALRSIADERDDLAEIVSIMQAEIAAAN